MARRPERLIRLAQVAILDQFEFSDSEIAHLLEVSRPTITTNRGMLDITSERRMPIRPASVGRFHFLLVTYSELMCKGVIDLVPKLAADDLALLRRALEYVLRVSEMLAHLKGVEAAISAPLVLEPETVPYYELFCAADRLFCARMKNTPRMVAKKPPTAEEFWLASLANMCLGKFPVGDFFSEQVAYLVPAYRAITGHLVRPQWSPKLQERFRGKIDAFVESSLRRGEQRVIRLHYGLLRLGVVGERQTFPQIAQVFDVPPERPRALHKIALEKLSRYFFSSTEKDWFAPLLLTSSEVLHEAIWQVEEGRDDEENLLQALASAVDSGVMLTPRQQRFLQKTPDEVDMSERLRLKLKKAGVRSFAEVVKKDESSWLKTFGFGRKLVNEIKEILGQRGLGLGMQLSPSPDSL